MMEPKDTQELVEVALERAIEALDVVALDADLDRELRGTQDLCNTALLELRGYGYDLHKEEWQGHDSD